MQDFSQRADDLIKKWLVCCVFHGERGCFEILGLMIRDEFYAIDAEARYDEFELSRRDADDGL